MLRVTDGVNITRVKNVGPQSVENRVRADRCCKVSEKPFTDTLSKPALRQASEPLILVSVKQMFVGTTSAS